jgi:hypothetical protein
MNSGSLGWDVLIFWRKSTNFEVSGMPSLCFWWVEKSDADGECNLLLGDEEMPLVSKGLKSDEKLRLLSKELVGVLSRFNPLASIESLGEGHTVKVSRRPGW